MDRKEYFMKGHNACNGCGPAIIMRIITKAAGPDTIIAHATGCMEVVSTLYPNTAWKLPWIHANFENAAAVGAGIETALKRLKKKTKVLVIAGDGGTYDIGLQALSGAVERGHDLLFVCYDNEAYANTGVQRSGATPKFADTTSTPYGKKVHGKTQNRKPIEFIMAAHGAKYVATAAIGYYNDLHDKVKKGLAVKGPAFIKVHAPCTLGWKYPYDKTIEISKLAVQTGLAPLYEIVDGELKFTKKVGNRLPVIKYLGMQGRYKKLAKKEVEEIQDYCDEHYKFLLSLEKKGRVFPRIF
ncbi:MAG: pyruvate synthase subunit beta [Nanoarchaeota archaeon]|nr:pyruvate synthase subunit beta [Nanoarchaeota archaeon]